MFEFMKCVAEAVVANGVKGLLELVPGGQFIYNVGADAIKRHREKKAHKKLEEDVKELVAARADAVFGAANEVIEQVASELPVRDKEVLKQFLTAIPEAARRSLKRKEDPTGTSLPIGYTIQSSADVVKLLPQHPMHFVPGDPLPGLSSYRLVKKLGGGGFGEVWLAEDELEGDQRAVKFCTDPEARRRLVEHERDMIKRVMKHGGKHPNIVALKAYSLDVAMPWLMYEFVPGITLTDLIISWQPLTPTDRFSRAVAALHTLTATVGHFHRFEPPIVHRDLKPANVLVQQAATHEEPVLRITDFGIGGAAVDFLVAEEKTLGARAVTGRLPTMLSGSYSLLYASPQQRDGEHPDPRDDVHALGVIAFQMLIGRVDAEVKGNWQKRLKTDGVPESLIDLIGNCVSDEPSDRPTAAECERILAEYLPKKTWRITMPGTWRYRPQGKPKVGWKKITETPAEIECRPDEEYLLNIATDVTDHQLAGLQQLRGLSAFTGLDMMDCANATERGFAQLSGLESLTMLSLWGCKGLNDVGLSHIRNLKKLTYLSLANCDGITDACLAHLRNLNKLTHLDLKYCAGITDAGLAHLSEVTALTYLDLTKCTQITDAGLAYLRGLSKLTELSLWRCDRITDAGLAHIRKLTALTDLTLWGCSQLTDAGLAHLRNLTRLEKLYLNSCEQITDAGLAHLRNLTALTTLDLSFTGEITDAGLAHLRNLIALTTLDMLWCEQITDAGLLHLRALSSLSKLNVNGCQQVTASGIAALQKALPKCEISHD